MPTLIKNTKSGNLCVMPDDRVDEFLCAGKPDTQHERSNQIPGRFVIASPDEVRHWIDTAPEKVADNYFDTDHRDHEDRNINPKNKPRYVADIKQRPAGKSKPKDKDPEPQKDDK